MNDTGRPVADPTQVRLLIDRLQQVSDDREYAEALADCIVDPDVNEQAAFRSPELAGRSLAATRYLIDHVNTTIKHRSDESRGSWQKRAEQYRNRVGMERRILQQIVDGLKAQKGVLPNAPNPRQRAYRELARRHPQEYLQLVREAEEELRAKAKAAKEARKAERRAQRG